MRLHLEDSIVRSPGAFDTRRLGAKACVADLGTRRSDRPAPHVDRDNLVRLQDEGQASASMTQGIPPFLLSRHGRCKNIVANYHHLSELFATIAPCRHLYRYASGSFIVLPIVLVGKEDHLHRGFARGTAGGGDGGDVGLASIVYPEERSPK